MNIETKRVLVALPTYNNGNHLPSLLEEVKKYSQYILIVNDGSTDSTGQFLKSINDSQIKILNHSENKGKGAALLTAFNYALESEFDYLVTLDTDGQHRPADILRFKEKIEESQTPTIFIGDRELDRSENSDIPKSSKFGRKFSDFWVWIETGKKATDTQSGFRAYPVKQVPLSDIRTSRYDFEIEVLVKSAWKKIPLISLPIQIYYPPKKERISHFLPFKDNLRLSLLHTRLVTLRIFKLLFSSRDEVDSQEKRGSTALRYSLKWGGVRFCYFFAPLIVFFYFVFSHSARRGIESFYFHLGIKEKLKRFWLSFKNFHFFAISMIDRMALSYDLKKVDVIWDSVPLDFSSDRGAILVGSHIGDWIFCGMKLRERLSHSLFLVMDRRFSKNFQSQMGSAYFKGLNIIDVMRDGLDVLLNIKEALDGGGMVCFLGDRHKFGAASMPSKSLNFLGKSADFPVSHFELALKLKRPIYAFISLKLEAKVDAPYHCSAVKLWDGKEAVSSDDLLKTYGEFLDSMLRKAPYNWFNFYDFWEMKKNESV